MRDFPIKQFLLNLVFFVGAGLIMFGSGIGIGSFSFWGMMLIMFAVSFVSYSVGWGHKEKLTEKHGRELEERLRMMKQSTDKISRDFNSLKLLARSRMGKTVVEIMKETPNLN